MRIALGAAVIAASCLAGEAVASDLPFEIQTRQFHNGLTLMMVPYPSPGLVAYYSMVRVGSRDETEPGVTGFAHFFEHMMFRGTKAYPPERVSAILKKAGADQNGYTTDDFTCYTFFGRSDILEELVAMEADRFMNLVYTKDQFKTEAKAVLGEYNKSSASPFLPLRERLREKVFSKHTYGHTTLGYLKDIEKMPTQFGYSLEFFKRFYTPDNTTIIVVGDFNRAELAALVDKHYSAWTGKRAPDKVTPEPRQTAEVRASVAWKTPTLPLLSLSWRTPKTDYRSKDTAVYNLLFELLFGKTSPLYTKLVLEQQLVDKFYDWNWNHRDSYLFHVIARLKGAGASAVAQTVEAEVDAAIAAFLDGKLAERRLADVKSHVRYALLLGMQTPDRVASLLAELAAANGDAGSLPLLLETIDEVTIDDVERFARLYLKKSGRSVVTLATTGGAK